MRRRIWERKALVLHISTINVKACCAELPMSQRVGVALSPNSVINNRTVRSGPLQSQITV